MTTTTKATGRYDYSAISERPQLRWPNNARVALWVVPNVEHYEYMPVLRGPRDPWPRMPHPDVLGYSHRDYGNRVGIWRLFDLVDELKIKCSVSLNLGVYEHFPEIMQACEQRSWDVICHGIYNSGNVLEMSAAEESDFIAECLARFRKLTNRTFDGWFTPHMSFTHNTVSLLAQHGVRYFCDWPFDDQPVRVETEHGNIVAMPYQYDINDGMFFNRRYRHGDAEVFARMIVDHFDRLCLEGEEQGRVMAIGLHPYLVGQPHNIGPLRKALKYILGHDAVWNATGIEILDWWSATQRPNPVNAQTQR